MVVRSLLESYSLLHVNLCSFNLLLSQLSLAFLFNADLFRVSAPLLKVIKFLLELDVYLNRILRNIAILDHLVNSGLISLHMSLPNPQLDVPLLNRLRPGLRRPSTPRTLRI